MLSRKGVWPMIAVGVGGVIGSSCYVKNTLCLKPFKRFVELYGNDGPIEPSIKLMDIVDEVNDDLKEYVSEYTPIKPFLIPGLNTLHSGTIGTFNGGIVGLPYFFEFNKRQDVEGKIVLNETSEKDMENVYEAFLLSDEAKKYGIAREILLVNTLQVYVGTVLPVAIPALIDKLLQNAKIQSEMAKLPPKIRIFYYICFFVIGLGLWRMIHYKIKLYYEKKAERDISKLDESYIRGGLEYNTKAIQRVSYSAGLKDQNSRVLKIIVDTIPSLTLERKIPISVKVAFYKDLLKTDDTQMENNV